MLSDCSPALVGRDIALEGDGSRNRLNGRQVDPNDQALRRHDLGGNLTPRSWCSTEIQQDLALLEEAIFLVQLYQLKRRPRSVTCSENQYCPRKSGPRRIPFSLASLYHLSRRP